MVGPIHQQPPGERPVLKPLEVVAAVQKAPHYHLVPTEQHMIQALDVRGESIPGDLAGFVEQLADQPLTAPFEPALR